jgi:hypothetical protein
VSFTPPRPTLNRRHGRSRPSRRAQESHGSAYRRIASVRADPPEDGRGRRLGVTGGLAASRLRHRPQRGRKRRPPCMRSCRRVPRARSPWADRQCSQHPASCPARGLVRGVDGGGDGVG